MSPTREPYVVRLRITAGTDAALLRRLHAGGLAEAAPLGWGDLAGELDAHELRSVYPLTDADFDDDAYGFARELQLVLGGRVAPADALAKLRALPGVERAEPLHFEHPS